MSKVHRQMIAIDEERCDGCGNCMPTCPEGALALVNGKARLVKESFCDGLGACLGDCPQGALRVVEVEADAYDEEGVIAHLRRTSPHMVEKHMAHLAAHGMTPASELIPLAATPKPALGACPSAQMRAWGTPAVEPAAPSAPRGRSELHQWPVQLHLVPVDAPFFQDADLYLVADCVPFAYPNFHADLLAGHAIAVGCPKLDDTNAYVKKMTQILSQSDIRSLTVVHMEVPCCRGLVVIAQRALEMSGKDIPFEGIVVSVQE